MAETSQSDAALPVTDAAEDVAGSREATAGAMKVCRHCQHVNAPDADACENCHKFVARTQAARQHGAFAMYQPIEVRARIEKFTSDLISDQGGLEDMTTIERGYAEKLTGIEQGLALLFEDMRRRGILTRSGGVRRVWAEFLAGVDRWDKVAQRLGSTRKAKRLNVAEALARLHEEHTS